MKAGATLRHFFLQRNYGSLLGRFRCQYFVRSVNASGSSRRHLRVRDFKVKPAPDGTPSNPRIGH